MRAALAIAGVELRRFLRDRSNIFFVFLFPLLLVLVLGVQFGGGASQGRVAVAGAHSELRTEIIAGLEAAEVSVTTSTADAAREQVARGRADAAVLVAPSAADRFVAGQDLTLRVVPGTQPSAPLVMQRLRAVTDELRAGRAQLEVLTRAGFASTEARQALARAAETVRPARLQTRDIGELAEEFSGLGRFDLQAVGETLLFVFLISVAGSATLIQARRLRVVSRTLAAPVSPLQVVLGEALGRFAIAAFQGIYIVVMTLILFGVNWGRLWLALLIIAVFSAVAAGAAMVLGSVLDNEGTASGVGVGLGLVLGALGGCMLPLELFPDTLKIVAHVTPHAWAYEALAEVQRRDARLVGVLPQLAVLVGMAAALITLGAWTLRRSLARAL